MKKIKVLTAIGNENLNNILRTKNEFDILEIIKNIKNYIWSGIAMFIVSTCCQFFIKTGLKCLIIQIALGAITYIVILILAKDEMIQKLFNIMKKRVKKEGI